MKKKAIVIGAIDAGKTTLINTLLNNQEKVRKTQTLHYHDWIVDTPGEYAENPLHHKNIMVSSMQTTHVIFVQSAVAVKNIFPPGFSHGIPKLSIGVVTKADLASADIERSINHLKRVMSKGPIVVASTVTGQGLAFIEPLVACETYDAMKTYVEETNDPHLHFIGE